MSRRWIKEKTQEIDADGVDDAANGIATNLGVGALAKGVSMLFKRVASAGGDNLVDEDDAAAAIHQLGGQGGTGGGGGGGQPVDIP